MKDIDFDELDKAVNSLMGGASSIKPDQPDPKTLTITATLKENEVPEYKKLEQAAERIGSETLLVPVERTEVLSLDDIDQTAGQFASDTPVIELSSSALTTVSPDATPDASPMITKRPAGRFMDVMHPSSDMKTAATRSTTVAPSVASSLALSSNAPTTGREGLTIASPVVPSESIVEPVFDTSTVQVLAVEQVPEWSDTANTPESFAQNLAISTIEAEVPSASVVTASANPVTFSPPPEQEPLISPFLPDAKVAKRPLGGGLATVDSVPENVTGEVLVQTAVEKDAQRALEITPEVSEEYFSDLMAIESGANVAMEIEDRSAIQQDDQTQNSFEAPQTIQDSIADSFVKPEPKTGEFEQKQDDTTQIQPTNVVEPVVQSDIIPAGPQSIAQQYSELPDSGDKESGSIYDVNDYHKPVSHPAKTSSGWFWVAIIIGIIAICGGGAAAFYFLTQNA